MDAVLITTLLTKTTVGVLRAFPERGFVFNAHILLEAQSNDNFWVPTVSVFDYASRPDILLSELYHFRTGPENLVSTFYYVKRNLEHLASVFIMLGKANKNFAPES